MYTYNVIDRTSLRYSVQCICEHVDMWICGHVDMWICGHVDMD